jgi:SAM-dependent methyltransferase
MSRAHYGSAHGASAEGYSIRAALRRHLREVVRGARVGTVLDVGCGYGALCGGAVTGIDTDPVVIAAARRRHVDPGLTFLLADAATLCCPVSGQPVALGEYDTVVCAHSLHNAAVNPESWEAWGANITKLGTKVLVVAFVSADVFGEAGRVEFGTSWAQRIADGTGEVPGTCLARRSLAWTASAGRPLVEPFVTETAVVDLFSKHGWVLKQASQPDPCPVDGWAKWVAHTHVLTFAR